MSTLAERQLQAAREIVAHIAERLEADISLELWNGEVLPLGPKATGDMRLVISSPGAVRRLLLKPNFITLYELFGFGDIGIEGGTPMQAAERWDHMKALSLPKTVNKAFIAKRLWPFLFGGDTPKAESEDAKKLGWSAPVGTKAGSARDDKSLISFHYDTSNHFFSLFLDKEMVYSSAYFPTRETTLDDAQKAKLDRICKKLRLQPGEHFLDIGCGWGALVCHAARHYGVKAHGVTLSQEQYDWCQEKIARENLGELVTAELRDYRSIERPEGYDKIAQIEMFEHLGIDNHELHFNSIRALLKPRGLYLHQASTRRAIKDIANFRKQTRYMEMITRYIFPGGELDYIGLSTTNLERLGFEVHDIENMREHFALTVKEWERRLAERREEAIAEVGIQKYRLWQLYFALCGRAFERGPILVYQTLASKRRSGLSGLPLARADFFK
jgi:cyclopropane-fatty-acyl-phospholipid synthase